MLKIKYFLINEFLNFDLHIFKKVTLKSYMSANSDRNQVNN